MHEDLHFLPQRPHPLHLSVSITGARTLLLAKKPRIVPTGHTELQYARPPLQAMMNRIMKETAAINQTEVLREQAKTLIPENYVCHYVNPECMDQPKLLIFGDSYLAGYDRFFINHFMLFFLFIIN